MFDLTPFEIGLLAGLIWAIVLIVWALVSMTSGEASQWLVLVAYIYEGFDFSTGGLLKGAAWAFADGFVSAYVISYVIQLLI